MIGTVSSGDATKVVTLTAEYLTTAILSVHANRLPNDIYIYIIVHIYVCIYIHSGLCVYVYMRICVYAYMHVCVYVYLRIRVYACMRICVCAYMCVYKLTHSIHELATVDPTYY